MMASRKGVANNRIGRSHAVSPWPEVNHTTISLSRYQRDRVSNTVTNNATDNRILK